MQNHPANSKDAPQLTESTRERALFAEKYIQPTQGMLEQSFNSSSKISSNLASGGRSIGVIPEEVVFEEVLITPNMQMQMQLSSAGHFTKVLLKNNLSSKVQLDLSCSSHNKVRIEPSQLLLQPYESSQVKVSLVLTDLHKLIEKKEQVTFRDVILIKSDYFVQKVNITANLVRLDDLKQSQFESSLLNSSGFRKSNIGGKAPVAGGGMTNALQRMRSLSKDIKEQKRSRENSLHKTVVDPKPKHQLKNEVTHLGTDTDEEISNKYGDHIPNNMTASFSQYKTEQHAKIQTKDKSFCLKDLEASQLRNDLDDSNIELEEEYDDIQRSHLREGRPNQFMKDKLKDKSLSLTQLHESHNTNLVVGKDKSSLELSERISQMQTQIMSYQKVIAEQKEAIKLQQRKCSQLEEILESQSPQENVMISQNPDLEELIELSIKKDRNEQQRLQEKKDQQVLEILKNKDAQLNELQDNYNQALQEIDMLLQNNSDQIENQLRDRIELLTLENNRLMDEAVDHQKQFQVIIGEYNQQLKSKDDKIVSLLQELSKAENVSLENRLQMVEQEKQINEKRHQEIADNQRQQINELKSKLNQSIQDIQRLTVNQSTTFTDKNPFQSMKTTVYDTPVMTFQVGTQTEAGVNLKDDQIKRLQNMVESLEKEKQQIYEILSQTDAKIDGLAPSELVTYTNYLKHQINTLSVQNLRELESSNLIEAPHLIEHSLVLQENINLKCNQHQPHEFYKSQLASRENMIATLKNQLTYQEQQFQQEIKRLLGQNSSKPTDDSDEVSQHLNHQFQELKISMTKLWCKFEELTILPDNKDNAIQQLHQSLKAASQTILKLTISLSERDQMLEQYPYLKNLAVKFKVMQVRQQLLLEIISQLKSSHATITSNQEKTIQDQQRELDQTKGSLLDKNNHITVLLSQLQEKDKYITWYDESLRQQAELQCDERQMNVDQRIKDYLRTEVLPFLKQAEEENCDQETMELVKRFCNLQLQLDSVKQVSSQKEAQIRADKSKIDHLENMLVQQRIEDTNREQTIQQLQLQLKNSNRSLSLLKAQDVSKCDKTLERIDKFIKKLESKSGELCSFDNQFDLHSQVESLQRQLIDIKQEQLLELEEIKANCQVEVLEERKKLEIQKDMFARKLNDKALMTNDETIAKTINELQAKLESVTNELQICEQRYENEKLKQFKLFDEISIYKEALADIKNDMCAPKTAAEVINDEENTYIDENHFTLQNTFQEVEDIKKKAKAKPITKKKKTLNDRKGSTESDSKASLVTMPVNQLGTNRSHQTQDKSHFKFRPPQLVQQLISAKVLEKQLKQELKRCKVNEDKAKTDLKKLMLEKPCSDIETALQQERVKNQLLEEKLRDIDFQSLLKGNQSQEDCSEITKEYNLTSQDASVLANTVIYLIGRETGEEAKEHDIQSVKDLDSVYKQIIIQLIKKITSLTDDYSFSLEQFVPSDEKSFKLWYLQLLENQIKQTENTTQKLYDFVTRLQIDVQGCLTAEAQIKATSLNLAKSTEEASQEVKLLKTVAQLMRSELESQVTTKNLISERDIVTSSSLDLQSQLKVTNKVKKALEEDLVMLKKQLYETKEQSRQQIQELGHHNKQLEKNLKMLEKELPKFKRDNQELGKKITQLEQENIELEAQLKQNISIEAKLLKPLNKKLQATIKQIEVDRQRDLQGWMDEKKALMLKLNDIEAALARKETTPIQTDMLKVTLESIQEENVIFQSQLDKAKQKINKLKNKVQTREFSLKELQQLESEQKRRAENLEAQLFDLKAKIDQQVIELNDKALTIQQRDLLIRQLSTQVKCLNSERKEQVAIVNTNSHQIEQEMNKLRENFANTVREMDKKEQSESLYKQIISSLQSNLESLHTKVEDQANRQFQEVTSAKENEEAMKIQIKLITNQNVQLKQDNHNLVAKLQICERTIQDQSNELSLTRVQLDEQIRLGEDIKVQLDASCQGLIRMKESFIKLEIDRDHNFKQLSERIEEIKEARISLSDLYVAQLELLRQKLQQNHGEKESDLIFQLSQRDALIQSLKKDVKGLKQKVKNPTKYDQTIEPNMLDNIDEEFDQLLNRARRFNELQEKNIEILADNQKTEGWNLVLIKQATEQENTINELRTQLQELVQKDCNDVKLKKMLEHQSDQIKMYKQQAKQLEIELSQLKLSWISPDRYKSEQQQLKDLQTQTKTLKDEASRKKDLISTLKVQKELIEKEKETLKGNNQKLNEENQKLNKLLKTQNNQNSQFKQLKQDHDGFKDKVTALNQENTILTERMKTLKSELQRKDQTIKDLLSSKEKQKPKDIKHFIGGDYSSIEHEQSDRTDEELKRKVKELRSKHKTDMEVKDNMIKALRSKMDQLQDNLDQLEKENASDMPMQMKDTALVEKQLKKEKSKAKKYEFIIKEALNGLRELTLLLQEVSKTSVGQPDIGDKDEAFYKESMDILGIELGELAEFMNPHQATSTSTVKLVLNKFNKISLTTSHEEVQDLILLKNQKQLLLVDEIQKVISECKNIINGN